ncbi:MAG: hypothetical protein NVS9B4_23910 [Candidatus Acidiferrum sp.]
MMIAWMILLLSVAAVLQFFVAYCRSLIAASARHVLSAEVKDVAGLAGAPDGDDFARVVQFLRLCPEQPDDRSGVQAIGAYYRLLNFANSTLAQIVPTVGAWTARERAQCAHFAAVALDRRIAFSRGMVAQQSET